MSRVSAEERSSVILGCGLVRPVTRAPSVTNADERGGCLDDLLVLDEGRSRLALT